MRYVTGIDEKGHPIDVKDPHVGAPARHRRCRKPRPPALAGGLLGVTEIFGTDLPQNAAFRDLVTAHLRSLFENGAIETVRRVVA